MKNNVMLRLLTLLSFISFIEILATELTNWKTFTAGVACLGFITLTLVDYNLRIKKALNSKGLG